MTLYGRRWRQLDLRFYLLRRARHTPAYTLLGRWVSYSVQRKHIVCPLCFSEPTFYMYLWRAYRLARTHTHTYTHIHTHTYIYTHRAASDQLHSANRVAAAATAPPPLLFMSQASNAIPNQQQQQKEGSGNQKSSSHYLAYRSGSRATLGSVDRPSPAEAAHLCVSKQASPPPPPPRLKLPRQRGDVAFDDALPKPQTFFKLPVRGWT